MRENLVNINFAAEREFRKDLEKQATREDRSLSNFLRHALKDYMRKVKGAETLGEKIDLLIQKTEKLTKQRK